MNELKAYLQNAINVTFVGSVLVGYINDAIAIVAGLTLVWWNVERALKARKERQEQ
tara:strand:- start:1106 stop:1273 length:168 start_codon:yes stop_codon:yes gene_type:complete